MKVHNSLTGRKEERVNVYETYMAWGAVASFSEAVHGYTFWQFELSTLMHDFAQSRFPPHHLLEIKQLVIANLLENWANF